MSLLEELKRRNVFKVAIAYLIVAWLAMQIADVILNNIAAPDWVFKALMLFLALGLPIALIFSWAFELTPQGLKREREVDRSQSITSQTGRKLDYLIIGVLVIAVGMLLVDKFLLTDATEPAPVVADAADAADASAQATPSIAVLPFVNMSADESSTYFSDGLADTVLHMLAQIQELRVAARTSSFQFRDLTMDVADIGQQLNVGAVLEGSVQRSGDQIRVMAQLIDVETGFHLWSGNFDRNLDNVFAIQDEIALEVVDALKISLLGETVEQLNAGQTENVDAYTAYLLAVNDLSSPSTETYSSAVEHLQEAVRIDPNFSQAYAALGRTYLGMAAYGSMRSTQAVEAARNVANKALAITPDLTESIAVLGAAELLDGNLDLAGQLLDKAIDQAPSDTVSLYYYGQYLASEVRLDEAAAVFERVIRLDPLTVRNYSALSNLLYAQLRFAESAAVIERAKAIDPTSSDITWFEAELAFERGDWVEAFDHMHRSNTLDPEDAEGPAMIALHYLDLDMPEEAARYFDKAVEVDAEHPMSLSGPLWLNYYLQENTAENVALARQLLEEGIENRRGSRAIALAVLLENAVATGEFDTVLGALDNLYPHLFDEPPTDLDDSFTGLFFSGWALMESGDTDRGTFLLQSWVELRQPFREAYGTFWGDVAVQLKLGDIETALHNFSIVEEREFGSARFRIMRERSSLYDPIREEPAFKAMLDRHRNLAAEQRKILRAANSP